LAIATLWPGSLFVLPGLIRAVRERRYTAMRFCLAWIVPCWLVFELVPTKLPHYILPAYPPLALLAGSVAMEAGPLFRRWWGWLFLAVWAMIGVVLAGGAMALPFMLSSGGFSWASAPTAAAALFAAFAPAALALRGRNRAAAGAAVAGALAVYAGLFQFVLPGFDRLWISQRVAAAMPQDRPAAAAGFHEPSLVFLLGTDTRLTNGDDAARFLLETPRGVAIVEDSADAAFQTTLEDSGRTLHQIAIVDGINYSRGRPARLILWELED
jgi:4-amino-4-deoxy-L-arabinose transferase-like glycosyltransferase